MKNLPPWRVKSPLEKVVRRKFFWMRVWLILTRKYTATSFAPAIDHGFRNSGDPFRFMRDLKASLELNAQEVVGKGYSVRVILDDPLLNKKASTLVLKREES